MWGCGAGKPARGVDVVEDKAELASLLEAEKSRRRLLEQRFATAEAEADKLRYHLLPSSYHWMDLSCLQALSISVHFQMCVGADRGHSKISGVSPGNIYMPSGHALL